MFKILQTCFAPWPFVQIILRTLTQKSFSFADRFSSHFNALGFTNRFKTWIQLRSSNVHYHFCFLSPKSCFKSVTVLKTFLKATSAPWSLCFRGSCGKKTFFTRLEVLRTLYSLIVHFETTQTLNCIFPYYFKAQSSNLSLLRVKTRLWKFLDLARKRTYCGREHAEQAPRAN